MLCDYFRSQGEIVQELREPGSTDAGERLRDVLISVPNLTPIAEACIVGASRSMLVSTVIKPALARNEIVVCDRYIDTTLVIQGYALGVPLSLLKAINWETTSGLMPDVTIYLDIHPEVALFRKKRAEDYNQLDARLVQLGAVYRKAYLELIAQDYTRWVYVPHTATEHDTPEQIHRRIVDRIQARRSFA